ncbi:MAG: hypothetical protein IJR83_02065, partial [Clostridia bacterium]|nr:hypothetical protein [Clostridia bacterium]
SYITIISTVTSASGFALFFSPFIFEHFKKRKKLCFIFRGVYYAGLLAGYPAVVLLDLPVGTKVILFAAVGGITTALANLASPALSDWHIYSLSEFCRSDYLTINNIITSLLSTFTTLGLSIFMDYLSANSMALAGILIMRGLAVIFVGLHFWQFNRVPEPEYNPNLKRTGIKEILTAPFKSWKFLVAVFIGMLMAFNNSFPGSFFSVYLLSDEGANFSYTLIGILEFFSLPCTIIFLPLWSKVIHRIGWMHTYAISVALYGVCYAFNGLVTPDTQWAYVVSVIYCQVVSGGMTLASANLLWMFIPVDMRNSCITFSSLMTTLTGTVTAILSGRFIAATNGKILTLFGLQLPNTAYICFISFAGCLLCSFILILACIFMGDQKPGDSTKDEKKEEVSSAPSDETAELSGQEETDIPAPEEVPAGEPEGARQTEA